MAKENKEASVVVENDEARIELNLNLNVKVSQKDPTPEITGEEQYLMMRHNLKPSPSNSSSKEDWWYTTYPLLKARMHCIPADFLYKLIILIIFTKIIKINLL